VAGWTAVSGCDSRQADGGIIAHGCDGFQAHLACAPHGPFIILFEQESTDECADGCLIGADADHTQRTLISPVKRSSGLVPWILARCCAGKFIWARTPASALTISAAS
jgi:hypothetical protein